MSMKARSAIGTFTFDEKGELADYKLFSRNPEKAVEEFVSAERDEAAQRILRKRMRDYALSLQFASSGEELNAFLSAFSLALSRKNMKGAIGRDKILVQAFNAMEDMNTTLNVFSERLKEWYTLHYPETKMSQRELVDAVVKYGKRDGFPGFRESTGVELGEDDIRILKEYASMINGMEARKKDMEKYVTGSVRQIAPNFSSLIDPVLAARFLAMAGGLEKLARMPASTIQLLGAEKALFRHLKKQGKSPKYGILYMDARIQNAAQDRKGKVARAIASKLMQGARIDFYSGRVEEKLKRELDEELSKI